MLRGPEARATPDSGVQVRRYDDVLVSHEWLALHGGSENVFEQIARSLPGSALQCLWNDAPGRFGDEVSETWLARTPLRRSKALALPFLSWAWQSISLEPYAKVVASSHAFGHHLAARAASEGRGAFAYVHTPARYVWNPELDARGQAVLAKSVAAGLKVLDRRHASTRVSYAANSDFVRGRIQAAWQVDATVIYPPVAVERIQSVEDWATRLTDAERTLVAELPDRFVLGASRLVEYKRLDLVMDVGAALDVPVVIAGGGPCERELRSYADGVDVPVHFVGRVSDELLYALYQRALLFVFMAVEDFGIMPVEAMAAGTPVLVNARGGASESVSLVGGGASVSSDAGPAQLREAASHALGAGDGDGMSARVARFGEGAFRDEINRWVCDGS